MFVCVCVYVCVCVCVRARACVGLRVRGEVASPCRFPLTIGKNCTIGHMVMLHGCQIGEGSLIGIGSTILNGVKIGKNCLIGAHTLIPEGKEIPDNSLVMGTPGKVVKQLTPEQVEKLGSAALGYVQNSARFRQECRLIQACPPSPP